MSSSLRANISPTSLSSCLSISSTKLRPSAAALRTGWHTAAVQAKIQEIFMPALSSTMTEGKIVSWIKAEGDVLSKGELIVVVESDKADMDVKTFYDGILAAIVVPEGESAPVGAPIGLLAGNEAEVAEAKAKAATGSAPASSPSAPPPPPTPAPTPPAAVAPPTAAAPAPNNGPRKIVVTPYAKKLAKQHKVDINSVVGTGNFGRITPVDVEAAAGIVKKSAPSPAAAAPVATAVAAPKGAPTYPEIPGATVVPFTTM